MREQPHLETLRLSSEQLKYMSEIKSLFETIISKSKKISEGRYKCLALNSLEESLMWYNKAISYNFLESEDTSSTNKQEENKT